MAPATDFTWPMMPLKNGGSVDLRVFSDEEPFSRFTTHLMHAANRQASLHFHRNIKL